MSENLPQGLPVEPKEDRDEFANAIVTNALNDWVNPEISRRKAAGTLPDTFELFMAQMLQRPGSSQEIRLNEEVRGVMYARANRDFNKGDAVELDDLEDLKSFDLTDEEIDCGHLTIVRTPKGWFCGFNFLSNRGKCLDLLAKADQFLAATIVAKEANHPAVAVDTLFSACELVSKAELVSHHMLSLDARTHGAIGSKINQWRKSGNIEGAFVDLFNRMGQLRGPYRYSATVVDPMPITEDDLAVAAGMIDAMRRRLGRNRPE